MAKFSEQVLFKNPKKDTIGYAICISTHEAFTGMALHELRTYPDFQALSCEAFFQWPDVTHGVFADESWGFHHHF